ncbi:MAG TPA: GNAT family N-acetyltransferase [Spirochaetia bacterium]|nr:GNAT family N-acetyltransferase [Spirochaetia bacterium]HRZ65921.1 GNAT family N-acetyltransferase [Spirochaetia bacterium]
MIEYRRAGPADAAALAGLRLEFMRLIKDLGPEEELAWRAELVGLFSSELSSGSLRAWVAVEGGRVVGASGLAVGPGRAAPGSGEILNMYTVPELRGRGIGTALLGLALGEARALGLGRLRLQPTDSGRPLYERAGFRDEGRGMVLDLTR